MPDGTTVPISITGKLASPFIEVDIYGQAVTYGDLRKLVLSRKPGLTLGLGNWRGWFDDGLLQQFQPCPEASGAVTGMPMEFEREDGTLESIELASIRGFIARLNKKPTGDTSDGLAERTSKILVRAPAGKTTSALHAAGALLHDVRYPVAAPDDAWQPPP